MLITLLRIHLCCKWCWPSDCFGWLYLSSKYSVGLTFIIQKGALLIVILSMFRSMLTQENWWHHANNGYLHLNYSADTFIYTVATYIYTTEQVRVKELDDWANTATVVTISQHHWHWIGIAPPVLTDFQSPLNPPFLYWPNVGPKLYQYW